MIESIMLLTLGFLIGSLREKWVYFRKTNRYLQDVKYLQRNKRR